MPYTIAIGGGITVVGWVVLFLLSKLMMRACNSPYSLYERWCSVGNGLDFFLTIIFPIAVMVIAAIFLVVFLLNANKG